MSWKKVKLKQILKQYRIEHLVQNDTEYKQVTISKYDGVTFRGSKIGREIGRKRQFQIDLKKYPNTLMFVRQGVQDGSIGIAPIEVDGCIATENMPMFSVEGINLEYLKFLLKSPYFYDELKKIQTTGSAQKSIHEREILEIEIPFPDIVEQEIIVAVLSSKKNNSLEITTELNHQLTLVKKLRQQLLQDAVQGKLVEQNPKDEPASELLKKIKAEKQKLIAEKKLKKEKELPPINPEEIPFEIPKNWVWCRLGEMVNIKSGKRIHAADYRPSGVPFLRSGEIGSLGRGENLKTELYISESKYQEVKQKFGIPKAGDILIACIGGSIGNTWVVDEREFYYKDGNLVLIETIPFLNKDFLLSYIKSPFFWNNTILNATDSSYNALTIIKLNDAEFPLPPLAEQNRIVQKLDELMQYCNELETSIKESESQNEKLLQQVLREALRKEPVIKK